MSATRPSTQGHENGWIVVQAQIHGTPESWWSISYSWLDHAVFPTKRGALKQGYLTLGHDDFNVGQVMDGHLVWWGWEDAPLLEDMPEVADALGLSIIDGKGSSSAPGGSS